MPPAIFISVDLPAPFSPISAWISPGATAKSTPLSTVTLPNDLRMPRMASRGARAVVLMGIAALPAASAREAWLAPRRVAALQRPGHHHKPPRGARAGPGGAGLIVPAAPPTCLAGGRRRHGAADTIARVHDRAGILARHHHPLRPQGRPGRHRRRRPGLLGQTVVKAQRPKVRRLGGGDVIAGFAGATADAFTLFERLEAKLEQHPGPADPRLRRARQGLAHRPLPAPARGDDGGGRQASVSLVLTGTGDVLEPEDGADRHRLGRQLRAGRGRAR